MLYMTAVVTLYIRICAGICIAYYILSHNIWYVIHYTFISYVCQRVSSVTLLYLCWLHDGVFTCTTSVTHINVIVVDVYMRVCVRVCVCVCAHMRVVVCNYCLILLTKFMYFLYDNMHILYVPSLRCLLHTVLRPYWFTQQI